MHNAILQWKDDWSFPKSLFRLHYICKESFIIYLWLIAIMQPSIRHLSSRFSWQRVNHRLSFVLNRPFQKIHVQWLWEFWSRLLSQQSTNATHLSFWYCFLNSQRGCFHRIHLHHRHHWCLHVSELLYHFSTLLKIIILWRYTWCTTSRKLSRLATVPATATISHISL